MTPLRICLDARQTGRGAGGVLQVVIGLASGLSKLTDGHEEYLFLTRPPDDEWIRPYIQGPCRTLQGPAGPRWKQWLESTMPVLLAVKHKLSPFVWRRSVSVPWSDGTIEKAGVHIMHFTTPAAFLTDVPSIYHPWDLQHIHLPQFFTRRARLVREVKYQTFCEQARMVSVASSWTKHDLIRHYGFAQAKVSVVPMAPALEAYPIPSDHDLVAARQKFRLPNAFIYYPAKTYPHKNHAGLLEALAILRERYGLKVPLICSGYLTDFFPKIKRRMRGLGQSHQVRFIGFVNALEVQCLYKLCRGMVFPTKFEGWGMPLMEAFLAGAPTACSNVTCLPEQARDAALIFDPESPEEIAQAIRRLWTDETLRKVLVERGKKRVASFTWDRTARLFRAHYRRIAKRPLTEEDRSLLSVPTPL